MRFSSNHNTTSATIKAQILKTIKLDVRTSMFALAQLNRARVCVCASQTLVFFTN